MVIDFGDLVVKFFVFAVSQGFHERVLLLDKSGELGLLIGTLRESLDLLRQIFDLLVEQLDLVSVLLILVFQIEKQLLVVSLLLLDLSHGRFLLGEVLGQLLVVLLQVLTVALLNAKNVLHAFHLSLELVALFLLFEDLLGHLLDHGLVLKASLVFDLELGELLLFAVQLFQEDVHINEPLFVASDDLLLAFLVFDLLLELFSLDFEVLSQRGDSLSELSVLLLKLIRTERVQNVFALELAVLCHLRQQLLLLILEHLNFDLICLEIDLCGLELFLKTIDLGSI